REGRALPFALAGRGERAAVHRREAAREAQADAETAIGGGAAAAIDAREHVEDAIDLLERDADARVDHADARDAALARELDADALPFGRELRRVMQQVAEDLHQPHAVG